MLSVLANRTYRHLFLAQIIALVGTGLATVALGLLAYDIAGGSAGAVLGTALAIKMVAYIGVAPIAGAFANRVPRRALLVSMDAIRAGVAICLPFVNQVWQVYVLIFVLQSASAAFTPTFQATIPDVLPEERDYTRALSLSRLAYDMESLTSPILAAGLLTVMSYHWLFSGTAIGFVASALLVVSTVLPRPAPVEAEGGIYDKTTRGTRIYLATPRLRGLLALTLTAAAASAMVIVNTVVIVKGMGFSQRDVALTLAAFGGGSITAALTLPRILDRVADRTVMLVAAAVLTLALAALAAITATMQPVPRILAHPAGRMACARRGLFGERHAVGKASAPLGERRRSPRIVRSAIRAQSRVLAGLLSARRPARRARRDGGGVRRDGDPRRDRHPRRCPLVAGERSRRDRP